MTRRGLLGAALLSMLGENALAQSRPRRSRPVEPLPPPPPPAPPRALAPSSQPGLVGEPAPMPNRDIEAPYRPDVDRRTTVLEPTMITPQSQSRGFTFGSEHAPNQDDRLFQEPAAGARLRIPLR